MTSKSDSAYTSTDNPDDWKLDISDKDHAAAAKAALGKGFRRKKVSIPESDRSEVIDKVNAACEKFGIDPISKAAAASDLTFEFQTPQNDKLYTEQQVYEYFESPRNVDDEVTMTVEGFEEPYAYINKDGVAFDWDMNRLGDIDDAEAWLEKHTLFEE